MGLLFDGVNDHASVAVNLSSYSQLTISFWLYWDSFANNDDMAMEYTVDGNLNDGFYINPNSSAVRWDFVSGNPVAGKYFTRPSSATWHHYVFTIDRSVAGGALTVYLNGVSQSMTNIASNTPGGNFANSTLYLMNRATTTLFGAGRMAEVALYPGIILGADKVLELVTYSPILVSRESLGWYWPMNEDGRELINGTSLTISGAVATTHPTIISSKKYIIEDSPSKVNFQIGGNAVTESINERYCISFYGSGYAESSSNPIAKTDDYWIHTWQKIGQSGNKTSLMSIGQEGFGAGSTMLQLSTAAYQQFRVLTASPSLTTNDLYINSKLVKENEWFCLSMCCKQSNYIRMYVNGYLAGETTISGHTFITSTKNIFLGFWNGFYANSSFGVVRVQTGGDVNTGLPHQRFYTETKRLYANKPRDMFDSRWFGLNNILLFRRTMLNNLRVGNRGESE